MGISARCGEKRGAVRLCRGAHTSTPPHASCGYLALFFVNIGWNRAADVRHFCWIARSDTARLFIMGHQHWHPTRTCSMADDQLRQLAHHDGGILRIFAGRPHLRSSDRTQKLTQLFHGSHYCVVVRHLRAFVAQACELARRKRAAREVRPGLDTNAVCMCASAD